MNKLPSPRLVLNIQDRRILARLRRSLVALIIEIERDRVRRRG